MPPGERNAAADAVRAELDQRLSAYAVAYPEVSVHTLVVEDRCAELLARSPTARG
jgi:hypothetical protein